MFKKISVALLLITNLQSQCWWFWPFSAPSESQGVIVKNNSSDSQGSNITYSGPAGAKYNSTLRTGAFSTFGDVTVEGNSAMKATLGSKFDGKIKISGNSSMYAGIGSKFNGEIEISGNSTLRTGIWSSFNEDAKVIVGTNSSLKIGLFSNRPQNVIYSGNSSVSRDYLTPSLYVGAICLLGFLANSYRK